MARKRRSTPLTVFLNTHAVGELVREASGAIHFRYLQSWLEHRQALPVSRSLPLREDRYTGAPVSAVFENLLPDYDPIRKRVAERVGADGTDAFSLLSHIGRDCVGALQFLPKGETPQPNGELTGQKISPESIGQMLKQLHVTPLGIRQDNDFRISIAGAQEKTALLYHNNQWIEPTGTTPTTHIIKPQIGTLPNGIDLSQSVQNEYMCLTLLRHFGLETATVEIATFDDQQALVVERFDRRWTAEGRLIRLPQEDCCQALSIPPTRKYQSESGPGITDIMGILRASDQPNLDRYRFFKTIILFWLMGATDGHAKNFSLALLSQSRFTMTPLYDVLSMQPALDQKQISHKEYKMAMRVGNSNQYNVERIRRRHFVDTGLKAGLSRDVIASIKEDIASIKDEALQATHAELPSEFPIALLDSVSAGIEQRLPRLLNG